MQAQTLKVNLSPDKSKINRSTNNGIATIFFESDIEDLRIINADEDQKEQINKINDNLWYINVDVNSDLKQDGVCYRHFLLKSTSSGEYDLTTDDILPNQVLYYNVFLPKIAGGVPLKVNATCDFGFDRGNFPDNVIGDISTLPRWRLGEGIDTIKVYRNLVNSKYDQVYFIELKGIINNINVGDKLTFIPSSPVFEQHIVTITDSIIKSNEVNFIFERKRSSLKGYIIDTNTNKPVSYCKTMLFLGSYDDQKIDFFGNYNSNWSGNNFGYRKNYETGVSICDYITKKDGYFGWGNCVLDYTYYINVRPPKGYKRMGLNDGVNIKPQDNIKDSLIIRVRPCVFKGVVKQGEKPIPDVKIECETLYGYKIIQTANDGSFEIIGPTSEFITFTHNDYRVMKVRFNEYDINDDLYIRIPMKKGKRVLNAEYKYGKIKEIKASKDK